MMTPKAHKIPAHKRFSRNKSALTALVLPATFFAFSGTAIAEYRDGSIEEATVLSADPVYRTVRVNDPVEECWEERVAVPVHNGYQSHTPKILGAIIGAAVGNKFGSGRGRHVATAAGAVLGGSIGRDVQAGNRHGHSRVAYEERCEVVDKISTERRIDGYDVTYQYNDQILQTFTERDPGPTLQVSVSVVPVER